MTSDSEHLTYDLSLLEGSQSAWDRSAGLRAVYADLYRDIAEQCVSGHSLEIGSGIAVSRDFFDQLTTSDIVKTPFVDCAMSAYTIRLQESGEPWSNIFALDVLHHLMEPLRFFDSAAEALATGGQLILMEPAATLWGRALYRACHHEPIAPNWIQPPFTFAPNGPDDSFANMGMGVGLFEQHREVVSESLAERGLRIVSVRYRDVLAYPLTGGYSKGQLLPTSCLRGLLRLESILPQFLLQRIGLRMQIVLEKEP